MAQMLVEQMAAKWEPGQFKDEYEQALMKVIEEKVAAGGNALPKIKGKKAPSTKVVDIVSMLQESLEQARKGKKPARRAA